MNEQQNMQAGHWDPFRSVSVQIGEARRIGPGFSDLPSMRSIKPVPALQARKKRIRKSNWEIAQSTIKRWERKQAIYDFLVKDGRALTSTQIGARVGERPDWLVHRALPAIRDLGVITSFRINNVTRWQRVDHYPRKLFRLFNKQRMEKGRT